MQITCPAEGEWPATNAGLTAYKSCGGDRFGFIRRACSLEGVWGEVVTDYCCTGVGVE